MKKSLLISLVLIGVMAFGLGIGTYAYFTSQATSEDNTFATGTLVIDSPGTLTTAEMGVDNIYPGWSDSRGVTVHNSGSLEFKYRVRVDSDPLVGNPLYDGDTPLQVSFDGVNYTDIDALDYVELGTIAAGGDGTFNIYFKLPEAADNDYQGAEATLTFVFDATQVGNPGWTE